MDIKNATIISTTLGTCDTGIPMYWIHMDYGGSGQGFGGIRLSDTFCPIFSILEVLGVDNWEDLRGKNIRVKCGFNKVYSIGHFLKDNWYTPECYATELEKLETQND